MADTFRYQSPPQIFDFVAFMGASPHIMGAWLPSSGSHVIRTPAKG